MRKILAISQGLLHSEKLQSVLPSANMFDISMLDKFSATGYFANCTQLGLMPRSGINNLPFSNHAVSALSVDMPKYDPFFNKTWADITDQRCLDIKKIIDSTGKILVVQWSGGIDSTCIVVSLLKNLSKEDRKQIIIACNWGGVLEYPKFYYEHIVPNFRTVDINEFTTKEYKINHAKYLVVNGMPADVLLQSVAGLDLCMALDDENLLTRSWSKDPDQLISYLSKITNSEEFGRWYFEKLSENISSVDVPIESYFDFTWWGGFNYHWISQIFFEWFGNRSDLSVSWQDHRSSFYYWYDTVDYQLWAMVNNKPLIKYGAHIGQFKLVSKQYIYEFTKDQWYYKYKLKMGSPGRNTQTADTNLAFAILDNFEILNLDQDLEMILELLPAYIQ